MASSGVHKPLKSNAAASKNFIGAVEDEWQLYSDRSSDYHLGLPIGFGASSTVFTATYQPPSDNGSKQPAPIPVALKVVNLEKLPARTLALLQRETSLMSLSKHPNVLRVRGSWMDGHKLCIALRLMNRGSAADIMRYGWPGGMEEDVIRCILAQGLEGLNYLHINGFIHRDIKAANFLIDDDGTVLLGDLGVAANLADDTSHSGSTSQTRTHAISAASAVSEAHGHHVRPRVNRQSSGDSQSRRVLLIDTVVPPKPILTKRKSFVGTPCWMAPELILGHQYDSAADIWSFGITALELAQGRPPRSRESHKKVLIKTIREDPPTLDREGGNYKYSRAFKEVVEKCLVKDPTQRPTARQLLDLPFFKNAKKGSYLVNTVLKDLPPLTSRQERRNLHNSLIHPTVASWDFTHFTRTPTSSRRTKTSSEEFIHTDDTFDFESPLSTRHSGSVSRAGTHLEDTLEKVSAEDNAEEPRGESSASEAEVVSESDVPSEEEHTSPPSSDPEVPDSPHPHPLPKKVVENPASITTNTSSSPISVPNKSEHPVQGTPSSLTPSKLSSSASSQSGLWNKLKGKAKPSKNDEDTKPTLGRKVKR